MMLTGYALEDEHTRLLADLRILSGGNGRMSGAFDELLEVFQIHVDKVEEFAVPLLKYLERRLAGIDFSNSGSLHADGRFLRQYPLLLEGHRLMVNILRKVEEFPEFWQNSTARDLVEEMRHHLAMEEQILYPAVTAAGEILREHPGIPSGQ